MQYEVRIKVLTPLHIGSGSTLLRDYDYVTHKGRTYRLNHEALLENSLGRAGTGSHEFDQILAGTPPGQLLTPNDYHQLDLFRYVMSGEPRSTKPGSQLLEQIKDAWDRPYVPGSSLKGAFRTVLAWQLIDKKLVNPDLKSLGEGRNAAKPIEQRIFGPDPNRDLMRALIVRDSRPAEHDCLMTLNVRVVGRTEKVLPIELEAVQPGTLFQMRILVNEHIQRDMVDKLGHPEEVVKSLQGLAPRARNFARRRVKNEMGFMEGRANMKAAASFYRQLGELIENWRESSTFPIQVGWGTGWDSKTIGDHLRADKDFFEGLVERRIRPKGWKQGRPFPQSRHLDDKGRPLGWLEVTMKRVA